MLRLTPGKNYVLGSTILNEQEILANSLENASIGDKCSVQIDESITRDLWGKSGVITKSMEIEEAVRTKWRQVIFNKVTKYFLKFDIPCRMSGVWLRAEQLF